MGTILHASTPIVRALPLVLSFRSNSQRGNRPISRISGCWKCISRANPSLGRGYTKAVMMDAELGEADDSRHETVSQLQSWPSQTSVILVEVGMNLIRKVQEGLIETLKRDGWRFKGLDEAVFCRWFKTLRVVIPSMPRKVWISDELVVQESLKDGYSALVARIEEGGGLAPYRSKQWKNVDRDHLFDRWGIHHLHLGVLHDGNDWAERTSEVLFAKFVDADAYLIKIMNHDEEDMSWWDRDLLVVCDRNWPQLFMEHPTTSPVIPAESLPRTTIRGGNPRPRLLHKSPSSRPLT